MTIKKGNLESDGFVLISNPFDSAYLHELISWLDIQLPFFSCNNFSTPHQFFGLQDKPGYGVMYDPWQRYPIFRPLASNPLVYDALRPVLGDDIYLYENSFLYKTNKTLDRVPWHQDFMNRPDEPLKYVAFIGLDRLEKDTGALRVIPGSHKRGFLPYHTKCGGEAHHTGIPEEFYPKLDTHLSLHLDQDAGDILIFNQLLVHSLDQRNPSSKSLSRSVRFSYQGFNNMYTPRLSPVTIFGGDPSFVIQNHYLPHSKAISARADEGPKSLFPRAYAKLKRLLS
jgi:phytanoyl-CoA hydroxylase